MTQFTTINLARAKRGDRYRRIDGITMELLGRTRYVVGGQDHLYFMQAVNDGFAYIQAYTASGTPIGATLGDEPTFLQIRRSLPDEPTNPTHPPHPPQAPMTTPPLCINCKHYQRYADNHICEHPRLAIPNVVTGRAVAPYCCDARSGEGLCRYVGLFFEAKE